jgi:hypothetical protein
MKKKAGKTKAKKTAKPKKKVVAKAKVATAKKTPAKRARRAAKKAKAKPPRPTVIPPAKGVLLGYVEDYFARVGVVALTLERPVALGAHLHVLGFTTNFEQTLDSMQMEHQTLLEAKKGQSVGFKVTTRARRGDHVYLIP